MTRARKNKKRKVVGWVLFLVVIVLVGVVCVVVREKLREEGHDGGNVETPAVQTAHNEPVVEVTPEKEVVEVADDGEKKVTQYEGVDPNVAEDLTGVVTYAGVSGGYLMVRVNIDQYLNGGSCRLVLTSGGGETYEESAVIVDAASTSTCEGFNVPLSQLNGASYSILVYLTSTDGRAGVISGEVKI